MLVSWDWLKQYVGLDVSAEVFADRLTMTGLNLEECHDVAGDTCIDFEVTSNRPDCLGHLGIAREAAVVYDKPLKVPAAAPRTGSTAVGPVTSVVNECPDLCAQYHARVIRGVKVGPSPAWLQRRLQTVGIASINNIVDITNYVLMECGQPLHAFDMDKLHGQRIVVRRAKAGEKLQAIDHKEYVLAPDMCVIADADHPVALAGVMGGAETEITAATKNVLIEAALFAPLSIRNTSRRLKLHSDSSYRFERALDPHGPDWASRRCCELILELAGGELLEGSVFAGTRPPEECPPITLRFAQIQRILGMEIPNDEAVRILTALGLTLVGSAAASYSAAETVTFVPPSNRRDLSREIDLIEEVARIHGYDQLPADVNVPLCLSHKSHRDRVVDRVRSTLTGAGFYEAITVSLVSEREHGLFQPRGEVTPLAIDHSDFRETSLLRQTLVPSLLGSRRANERRGTFGAQLFEIAGVHLSADKTLPHTQSEPTMVSFVSGKSFAEIKGVVQELAARVNPSAQIVVRPSSIPQFTEGRGAEVLLNGQFWGWLGELDRSVAGQLDLRDPVTVAELELSVLESVADLVPKFKPLPTYQSSSRDLNFVLDDPVTWSELESVARGAAGPLLEAIGFGGQYRGKQIPEGKKSYLVTLMYRSPERTLTSEEVEAAQQSVIVACQAQLGATLRA
ncbi:MAG: phenylalanine--tRNA ligase subunit beta [Planctomycetes bacterium]|nr:phenylalanine--tRNA ligase subunit beta [Planctomycetota bacterium]